MDVSLARSGKSFCSALQLCVHSVEVKRNSSSPVKTVRPRAGMIHLCTILAVEAVRAELKRGMERSWREADPSPWPQSMPN